MKTIKFTISTKRPEKSLIKFLKLAEELQSQGIQNVCLVAYNGIHYYKIEWIKFFWDKNPRDTAKQVESLLDRMFLSRLLTYSQCHKVDLAIRELWP